MLRLDECLKQCIEQRDETDQAGRQRRRPMDIQSRHDFLRPLNVGRRGQKSALDFPLRLIREAVGTKITRNFTFDLTLARHHHGVEQSAKETETISRWRLGDEAAFGDGDWSISHGSSPSIGFDDSKAFPVSCCYDR